MAPRIVVVGLGPAGADLMLPAARAALERIPARFARTVRHPAIADLAAAGVELRCFDAHYERAGTLDEVYSGITDALVAAATAEGEVAYAVPGNPVVAEHTVALLHETARRGVITLDVVPGLSFAELAWARLGIDPMTGGRVLDARDLDAEAINVEGPLLLAQCDSRLVLSDVKLALLDVLPVDAPVTALQRLGLPDERVITVAVADLDRDVEPDHLTALFVETPAASSVRELTRLLALAEHLRGPGGCPWDAEQTHRSLTRYLLEEAYEVVEAVEALPLDAPGGDIAPDAYRALEDELGDLLYQVIFHAVLAQETRAFTMADVARGIHDKLVRRHPHVFGDAAAATSSEVMHHWEQIKKDEKRATSIVSGITPGLPSLLYTHKLLRKAASVGLEPGTRTDALERMHKVLANLRSHDADLYGSLGELLAAAVVLARTGGIDAESALRGWAARFRRRFEAMEQLAAERGIDLASLGPAAIEALWDEADDRTTTGGAG